jgi:hypothetical protein
MISVMTLLRYVNVPRTSLICTINPLTVIAWAPPRSGTPQRH